MADNWLFEAAHVKLADWMAPFGNMFTAPTWQRVLVLLIGAVLSPGRRTVAAALRVTGLDQDPHFTNYHRVLNRGRWSSRRVARCLFGLLVNTFVPSGPVIIGLDDTLERRWGAKIAARGIYRDPTLSSHGHFVKASGLRWLSIMVLPEIAFAGRVWGLPFLTALAPSERYAMQRQRRHKKLTDWGRQVLLQTARWFPGRQIIGVADSSYASIDLLNSVRSRICMITRLRLDARLFDPPARRRPGTSGGPVSLERARPAWPNAWLIRRRAGGASRSPAGMDGANGWWKSCPAPPCGIIPDASCQSVIDRAAISLGIRGRRPSSPPHST